MLKKIVSAILLMGSLMQAQNRKIPKTGPGDEVLMDTLQRQTLKYFWQDAEPNSLLARERYHEDGIYPQNDKNTVTTGGSGFGLMTILVGIQRGFINRAEAVERLNHITDFLAKADRYKGAWPHWMEGATGKTIPFGEKDNGGDLVETAFLTQGLICVREFFKNGNPKERQLAKKCDTLWKGVQWNWFTKGGEKVLYWHWSPTYGWAMNFPLKGYNECLITYILAASSPQYAIDAATYAQGWARSGGIKSGKEKYGLKLFVNHNGSPEYGGPLFWAHYSYLGLDPRGLSDGYVQDYFTMNKNQVLIDYKYCQQNPKQYKGYSPDYWGLTAGYTRNEDGTVGYTAHMPTNDAGVIVPTAALSSMPYTPKESLAFLHYIYERQPQFIGAAGPYDATSIHYNGWFTPRYLAIDQGTIAPMVENYRTGMLWKLFMNAPEIKKGLKKLGFHDKRYGI